MIAAGKQERLFNEQTVGAGTKSRESVIETDSLVATVYVNQITSGTLDVSVYTLTDSGKESLLFSFPQVSAASTDLLLKKSGISMQRFRIVATYTGICNYEIYVRAVEGAGESSTRILGSGTLSTSQMDVGNTPVVLIASELTDRNGLTIRNFSGGSNLFVSEDTNKLPDEAWILTPGEVWSLDVSAGVTIYAQSAANELDVRIAQSGQ